MGIIGGAIVYGFGKRRGRKEAERNAPRPAARRGSPACVDYDYCEARGECDMECHFEDDDE